MTHGRTDIHFGRHRADVSFAVAGIVHSFVVFVAMYALAGLGNTAYHPADYSHLYHHIPPARIISEEHTYELHSQ